MNIIRLFHTIIHLKPIQIRYQIWYRICRYWRKLIGYKYTLSIEKEGNPIVLKPFINKYTSLNGDQFTFLNLSKSFPQNTIDWNYSEYGKLWTYNLNYFDFLHQEKIDPEIGLKLIDEYIKNLNQNSTGLEPYTIALRGINWIKFLSKPKKSNAPIFSNSHHLKFSSSLYAQYQILLDNLEYHLLGNHLLEDGFSLLFGAFYFKDLNLYNKAINLIKRELTEQILEDGGHFELSPMYHQIILDRLLDSINLIQNNQRFDDQDKFLDFLKEKDLAMQYWLNQMSFSNGDIPHFNDSTFDIAPTSKQLIDYATELQLNLNLPVRRSNSEGGNLNLTTSGYRKLKNNNYECIVDVGQIGPDYIPGHAHADMLSFVLYIDNKPIIIDTGVSTYEKNDQRHLERSTSSHNTVVVEDKNQSDVWGGFRVGKRAKIMLLKDEVLLIEAEHNGYRPVTHKRSFNFSKSGFAISDLLSDSKANAKTYFHFHPDRKLELQGSTILIDDKHTLEFKTITNIKLENYNCPQGYNKYSRAIKCIIAFKSSMQTEIKINR